MIDMDILQMHGGKSLPPNRGGLIHPGCHFPI
jgi:hypothetical protein